MAFLSDSGVFAVSTAAAGTGTNITWAHTGEQPKALLFYTVGRTDASDAIGIADKKSSIGFASSPTSRYCVASAATDGATVSDGSKRMSNESVIEILDIAGAGVEGKLDLDALVNWPSNGFRVIIDEQFTNAYQIGWIAWGGSDITDATTFAFQEPAATGNQDITTPGFTCVDGEGVAFFLSMADATSPAGGAMFINSRAGQMMLGAASASTKYAVISCTDDQGSANMDCTSYCSDDLVIAMSPDTGGGSVTARATFNAWITNGFQLAWSERASTRYIAALVVKGGKWEVGSFLTQTDTTTNIVENGFGFTPASVLVVSGQKAESAADTAAAHDQISVGAFTSASNRHCQSYLSINAGGLEDIQSAIEYDAVYANLTSGAIEGLADVVSMDSDGFTLIMDDADPSASFVWYVASGAAAAVTTSFPFRRRMHQALLNN
ncbi:MAG TPA: hypothetical protein VGK73_03030 [Polyangiaceae bacterium]